MEFPHVIFSTRIDHALGWTVIHSIWQVTLIALLTGILLVALRHQSAQIRYWVVNLALLAVLGTALATFSRYLQEAPNLPVGAQLDQAAAFQPEMASADHPRPALNINETLPIGSGAVAGSSGESNIVGLRHSILNGLQQFSAFFNGHLPVFLLLWIAGLAIFLFKLLSGLLQVYDLRRRMNFHADPYWVDMLDGLIQKSGFRRGVQLVESALVHSPITIGHFRPLILFPIGLINRLPEQEVEAILAHELAHIVRRDYLFNILQCLIETVFYFHPAIWWLSGQARNEREHACDDRAIVLLGNKVTYAKALVTIQEMTFYPSLSALAFAGSRQGQLMRRVQRLFAAKKSFNMIEKWISTALVVCFVMVLAVGQHFRNDNTPPSSAHTTEHFTLTSGIWEAEFTKDSVHLTITSRENQGNWMHGDRYAKTSFANLTVANGKTTFEMNRPAGKMVFTGEIEGNGGYGRYTFTPDASYRSELERHGIKAVDDELMMLCFFADFPANYPASLQKMGFKNITTDDLQSLAAFKMDEPTIRSYQDLASSLGNKELTVDELVQLKVSNVTSATVKSLAKAGYTDLSLEDISQLSLHGVEPEYIAAINGAGLGKLSGEDLLTAKIHGLDPAFVQQAKNLGFSNLNFDDVMTMKIHGVDADFVKQAKDLGFNNLNLDEVMTMKVHGVDADFVKQAKSLGFSNLSFDDIVTMKVHGVDADFVKQAKSLGFDNLSFDDIMTMKVHGVDADFVKQAKGAGFDNLSFDDVMSMKIHDVNADYLKQARSLGFDNLSFDDVMTMKIHGVDAAFVKEAKSMGFNNLSFDDVVSMKIHGIDPKFLQACKDMDLGNLTFDDVMEIRIHGITPEMAKKYRAMGFKNLKADDLVAAKIHDVTPEFIKEAEKKGYRFPSLSEYADLKVRWHAHSEREK